MGTSIHLKTITSLPTDAQLQIRDIRNQPDIRAVMFTDHVIGLNEHLQWLQRLKHDRTQIALAVLDESEALLGFVGLQRIDRAHKKADWAFYLSEEARSGGLGSVLEWSAVQFAFERLQLEKLNCEVIEGNNPVLKLHKRFFFEDEGFRQSNLVKQGRRIGVHLLGLRREAWVENRASLLDRYRPIFESFDIHIDWTDPDETQPAPIDQIETARARNNLNWMSIMRIALERSPHVAGQIVSEIKNIDQEISGLTQKVIESMKQRPY